jgi:hypothetical protein
MYLLGIVLLADLGEPVALSPREPLLIEGCCKGNSIDMGFNVNVNMAFKASIKGTLLAHSQKSIKIKGSSIYRKYGRKRIIVGTVILVVGNIASSDVQDHATNGG